MGDRVAACTQLGDERSQAGERALQRLQLGQLTADVQRQPARRETGQGRHAVIHLHRMAHQHAELAVRPAGGDLVVRACIDIGVHAQHASCPKPARRGDGRQFLGFFERFDVELTHPAVERQL
jgi:hypothetical protein